MSIITVDNLSKRYRIGRQGRGWDSGLRHALTDMVTRPFRRHKKVKEDETEFWALKDVSFEVEEGEVLGIIGRNGAGKSTLLKILSRITWPTSGEVRMRGRVASLLEVGTGFHPELTGRENIYLNGSILGMTRAEVKKKFDEIVAFSEIEKFLDTPVKRYSSGMYVRLAFAVAAHLEPEILLVDEVLAVGDAEFQKKCLGKMGEVAKGGRTVLFVSHNMMSVKSLCEKCLLLEEGLLKMHGTIEKVIENYLSHGNEKKGGDYNLENWKYRQGTGEIKILNARMLNDKGESSDLFYQGCPMSVEFTFISMIEKEIYFSAAILTSDGIRVIHLDQYDGGSKNVIVSKGMYKVRVNINSLPLSCGSYDFILATHSKSMLPLDVVMNVLRFNVEDVLTSERPYKLLSKYGLVRTDNTWDIKKL